MELTTLTTWTNPEPEQIPDQLEAFLQLLPGPTAFHVHGGDRSRTRVLVTLSHGNEPSGLDAVRRWLRAGRTPHVNLVIVVGSVEAARAEPLFHFRTLPGDRDLNRCFNPPYTDRAGRLAQAMLRHIEDHEPEAVVDLHNTSGHNPPFTVATGDSEQLRSLAGLFAHRMIVSDLRLGSLMEQNPGCPVLTVEAGGSHDAAAARICDTGLEAFFHLEDVFASPTGSSVELLRHPHRLELQPLARVGYGERALGDRHVTMRADIERFNFSWVKPSEPLGWASSLDDLRVALGADLHEPRDFFRWHTGQIFPRQAMRIFMATTRADIAASDCLFYFVLDAA